MEQHLSLQFQPGWNSGKSNKGKNPNKTVYSLYLRPVHLSTVEGRTKSIQLLALLVIVGLLVNLMPAFTSPASPSTSNTFNVQPQLVQQATQQPDALVSVIVQKSNPTFSIEQAVTRLGGKVTKDLHIINGFGADLPAGQVSALSQTPGVRWVSLDAPLVKSATSFVSGTNLVNTYNSDVSADKVWQSKSSAGSALQGQGIGVAIVDSGIAPNADFGNGSQIVANNKFNSNAYSTVDYYGHGTAVAGIVAGNGTNSQGQNIGIAPQANLINVKVSDDFGNIKASDMVAGLQWINDNKAKYNIRVVNISLNSSIAQSYNVDPLDAAAEVLWFNGIVVVTSAGNNGSANLYAPANDPFVITVGAVDDASTNNLSDDTVAPFSAWGTDELGNSKPDLVAPGSNLVTAIPSLSVVLAKTHPEKLRKGNYIIASGTSFAAPVVSGAVALLLQSEPNLNPDQVKNRLKATALEDQSRGDWDTRDDWDNYNPTQTGAGYLDIYSAITQKQILATANTGQPISKLISTGTSSAATATATGSTSPTYSANGLTVQYTVTNQWANNNGADAYYQVTVNLINNTTSPISNWKVKWQLVNGEAISNSNNANCSISSGSITCSNMSYNGTLAAKGGSASFGITFSSHKTSAPNPASLSVTTNTGTTVINSSASSGTSTTSTTANSSSVNWSSVNWSSVNWSSVNWSSVNWSSVNWSSDFWG